MEACAAWKVKRRISDDGPVYAITWIDTAQNHIVALLDNEKGGEEDSSTSSTHTPRNDLYVSVDLFFHILSFPPKNPFSRHLGGLEKVVTVPRSLLLQAKENGGAPTVCTPQLAKFSLDGTLVALQMSSTCIRIVAVRSNNNSGKKQHTKHYTIELASGDPNPVSTGPDSMAKFRYSYKAVTDPILSGGVIWSDHGGNSQDLIVVTRKNVICYKISVRRNQMSVTHSFPQPDASAVWWEPISRTAVIGSFGPASMSRKEYDGIKEADALYLRTFFLHSAPKPPEMKTALGMGLALPRFELPPPDRLPIFPVGLSRLEEGCLDSIELNEVALVCLYKQPYIVELQWYQENAELKLKLFFHHLSRRTRKVSSKTCTVLVTLLDSDSGEVDLPLVVIGVLDDLLCLSFPSLGTQVFCDVSDESCDSVLAIETNLAQEDPISESHQVAFIAPSLLIDPTEEGTIYALELDMQKLCNAIESDAEAVSFLLRRRSLSAHRFALERISRAVLASSSFVVMNQQLRELIQQIVVVYARQKDVVQAHDLVATSSLVFACALLPPNDGAFKSSSFHHVNWRLHDSTEGSSQTASFDDKVPGVISQRDILEHVLVPGVKGADDFSMLERLLSVSVELAIALNHEGCRPCVALATFILALYWRMGRSLQVLYMLRSHVFFSVESFSREQARQLGEMVWLFITEQSQSPATSGQRRAINENRHIADLILDAAEPLLASDPILFVSFLLKRRLLFRAMTICTNLATFEERQKKERGSSFSRSLLQRAKVLFRGEDFFGVAVEIGEHHQQEQHDWIDPCCLLQSLYSFLQRWDPSCLTRTESSIFTASRQRWILDRREGNPYPSSCRASGPSTERLIQRRPSWVASKIVEQRGSEGYRNNTNNDYDDGVVRRMSRLAGLFPGAFDCTFPALDLRDRQHVKELFGYTSEKVRCSMGVHI